MTKEVRRKEREKESKVGEDACNHYSRQTNKQKEANKQTKGKLKKRCPETQKQTILTLLSDRKAFS